MLGKALKYGLLVYLVLCGGFYFYQHLFFFQPRKLDVNHVLTFPVQIRFAEAKLPFDSATIIDVVKFLPDDSVPRGVVLFFHGNRYNVEHYSTYAPYFTSKGYECWMPDYPGYGRSSGEISVPVLKEVALQLYKMARAKYPAEKIMLYGKSLGSGIAAYTASQRDCRLLMLETPYRSLSQLAAAYLFLVPVKWLMHADLETEAYLPLVQAPIVAWHGTDDELIPVTHAASLTTHFKPGDQLYIVADATHNSLPAFVSYRHSLDSVLHAVSQ
jgi:hypothetical protein